MKKLSFAACMIAMMAMCVGCSSDAPEDGEMPPLRKYEEPSGEYTPYRSIEMDADTEAVVDMTGEFSFRFFREVMNRNEKNSVVSPASIAIALAMTANGDSGVSRDEILTLLGFDPAKYNIDHLNEYCRIMLTELPKLDGQTACRFANSFWHAPEKKLKKPFTDILINTYVSEDIPVTPSGEYGMKCINKWVDNYTNGMIPEFLKTPLNESIDLFLLNATYFKGKWTKEFKEKDSCQGDFRNLDNTVSKAIFMNTVAPFRYVKTDRMQAISMPFGNGNFEMTALLPSQELNFDEFIKSVSFEEFKAVIAQMHSRENALVTLSFPKFQTEINEDMTEMMKNMGLEKTFNRGLDDIFPDFKAFITKIQQAVKIKVDETGAEAAAVTGIGIETSGVPEYSEEVKLDFNRPFLYVIRETSTGTILFMGKEAWF